MFDITVIIMYRTDFMEIKAILLSTNAFKGTQLQQGLCIVKTAKG